jgi:hypothetical protein
MGDVPKFASFLPRVATRLLRSSAASLVTARLYTVATCQLQCIITGRLKFGHVVRPPGLPHGTPPCFGRKCDAGCDTKGQVISVLTSLSLTLSSAEICTEWRSARV